MEPTNDIAKRLETAASLLERALAWLEERQASLTGQVEKISATVEQSRREEELAARLADAEREIAELRASSQPGHEQVPQRTPLQPAALRRTVPASTSEMLAKHGIGEGPTDARLVDAALAGLSLEQRIAVKSQLLRAGALT